MVDRNGATHARDVGRHVRGWFQTVAIFSFALAVAFTILIFSSAPAEYAPFVAIVFAAPLLVLGGVFWSRGNSPRLSLSDGAISIGGEPIGHDALVRVERRLPWVIVEWRDESDARRRAKVLADVDASTTHAIDEVILSATQDELVPGAELSDPEATEKHETSFLGRLESRPHLFRVWLKEDGVDVLHRSSRWHVGFHQIRAVGRGSGTTGLHGGDPPNRWSRDFAQPDFSGGPSRSRFVVLRLSKGRGPLPEQVPFAARSTAEALQITRLLRDRTV